MSDLFELTKNGIVVYSSGGTVTPGPTPPPGPVVPGPVVPPPSPPVTGALARYDSCFSQTSKIQGMSDAEQSALIAAGRSDANTLNNLRGWFFYKGINTWRMSVNTAGQYVYKMDVQIAGSWYTKIESAADSFDQYNPNMPCPWRVP